MTKEELIKDCFPNDKFIQSAVSQIVDKCTIALEEENAKLKSQIEKMKCCENCRYVTLNRSFEPICVAKNGIIIENPFICKCDKWER